MAGPARSDITGLVLAGGRGARMGGVDKGWVVVDGEPLVRQVLRRLAPQVDGVLISANRTLDAYRALADVVTDAEAGIALENFPGPLVGVLAGLRRAVTPWVAIAPCDAPALPSDLVARLAAAADGATAVLARVEGRLQPVFALVPTRAAGSLHAYLEQGGRAMHGWFESIGAVAADFDDPGAFANLNALPAAASVASRP